MEAVEFGLRVCVGGGEIQPRLHNESSNWWRWWDWVFTLRIAVELKGGPWVERCQRRQSLPQPQPHFQLVVSRRVFILQSVRIMSGSEREVITLASTRAAAAAAALFNNE